MTSVQGFQSLSCLELRCCCRNLNIPVVPVVFQCEANVSIAPLLTCLLELHLLLQKPGVEGFFSAKDVPGGNDIGAVVHDEECFASEVVTCVGQPIGVIVADTEQHARMAARLVKVEYEDLPALISIEDAIEAESYYQVGVRVQLLRNQL